MDITAVITPIKHDVDVSHQEENSFEVSQSSQESQDEWLYPDASPMRKRAESCPERPKPDTRSHFQPSNLAFTRHYSLFSSKGLTKPDLSEQIEEYNRKHDSMLCLQMDSDEDQVYSGLLQFQYFNGKEMETENIPVKSTDSVADLIPELKSTFLQSSRQLEPSTEETGGSHSYVALVQGEMERELDVMEKPLEIALDCSSKGLASPKFLFKSPLTEQADTPSTPHQTNRFTSYLGSLALPSGSSENEESPSSTRLAKASTNEYDQSSMISFGSALSIASSKSGKTKSTSSLVLKTKKKKLAHTMSNQETGTALKGEASSDSTPPHHRSHLQIDSPGSRRKLARPKSIMPNFITRSLRVRRKHKQSAKKPSTDSPQDIDRFQDAKEEIMQVNSLISPIPVERKFTMSSVMHIYYMKPKQIQLYKSVLVSENASTREVISQALERYNMKLSSPDDFGLFEVIGKWQDITSTLPPNLSFQASNMNHEDSATLPGLSLKNTSPLVNRRTAVEEFVICYSRELHPNENPYNTQFYLDTKEGYTRRFELRPKTTANVTMSRKQSTTSDSVVEGIGESQAMKQQRSASAAQISSTPESSPGIFGQTTHRKRARRNRLTNTATSKEEEPVTRDTSANDVDTSKQSADSENDSRGSTRLDIRILNPTPEELDSSVPAGSEADVKNSKAKPTATLDTPFLLSVRVFDPTRESLIHLLTRDTTNLVFSKDKPGSPKGNDSNIVLCHSDLEESTAEVCSICQLPIRDRSKTSRYQISPKSSSVPLLINGKPINENAPLQHGDIISIGQYHMLLFQDFSSLPSEHRQNYNWEPCPVVSKEPGETNEVRPSSQLSISSSSTNSESGGKLKIKSAILGNRCHSRSGSEISLTVEDVDSHTITAIDLSKLNLGESNKTLHHTTKALVPEGLAGQNAHTRLIMKQMVQDETSSRDDNELVVSMPTNSEVFANDADDSFHSPVFSSPANLSKKQLKQSTSLPSHQSSTKKMMFSYLLNEEDALLISIIDQFDSTNVAVHLGPAYALSMCVEYGMMCYGPRAMTKFVKKATNHIQSVAWDSCKRLSEWQMDQEKAQKPLTILQELFTRLEAALYWLANTLEFYHFLTANCGSLNLSESRGQDQEQSSEDILFKLYNVLAYTFQQAFYSISRVLFYSFPVMLDGCTEDKLSGKTNQPIVIDQAVEFLQALLDLLTKYHVHLEVISQFYANVFFFTNAVMFNALIEQGGDLALYQYNCGQALRSNLNLVEGWGCQVGFRDNVLHYLAKFSGAIDLLACPPTQLLQMDWRQLRKEFPMLHPAQLHFILSQYLLPVAQMPSHWTPSKEDALHAVKTGALQESFDHHPSFELPTSGYTLDLTKPPQEMDQLQSYLDGLRKQLKNPKRSVDVVPVTESQPITTYTNGNSSENVQPTLQGTKPHTTRTLLINDSPIRARRNIGSNTESQEDLLEDTRNNHRNTKQVENFKYEDQAHIISSPPEVSYHTSAVNGTEKTNSSKTSLRGSGREQIVERVHSIIAPRSFQTPEKFLLEPDDGDAHGSSWLMANFPPNAETVTIPRGDKGFGLIMVEGKEPGSTNSAIFVQGVIPGSTAEKCAQVKSGDRILSIEGQLLDGADYIIADKYLKEAEDDVTLVIIRSQRKH